MKKLLLIIVVTLAAFWLLGKCSGCNSSSPVGTYRADLTIAQTGNSLTTIVLNENGSATMTQAGFDTEYTYWDYAGKGIDVRIKVQGVGEHYFMDFDEKRIYFGADNYRSCTNGHTFKKID